MRSSTSWTDLFARRIDVDSGPKDGGMHLAELVVPDLAEGARGGATEPIRYEVVGRDCKVVRFDVPAPRWLLSWWVDSRTVAGSAIHGPGSGEGIGADNTASLMTCTVPAATCQILDGSTGEDESVSERVGFPSTSGPRLAEQSEGLASSVRGRIPTWPRTSASRALLKAVVGGLV